MIINALKLLKYSSLEHEPNFSNVKHSNTNIPYKLCLSINIGWDIILLILSEYKLEKLILILFELKFILFFNYIFITEIRIFIS